MAQSIKVQNSTQKKIKRDEFFGDKLDVQIIFFGII